MCLSSVLGAYLRNRLVTSLRGGPASPITDVLTLTFYYLAIDLKYLFWFLYFASLTWFISISWCSRMPCQLDRLSVPLRYKGRVYGINRVSTGYLEQNPPNPTSICSQIAADGALRSANTPYLKPKSQNTPSIHLLLEIRG
jgi:hypothetical protein